MMNFYGFNMRISFATLFIASTLLVSVQTIANYERITKNIFIPKGQDWKMDFLTPDDGYFNHNESNIQIFDFNSPDNRPYQVTFVFQEYYWNFQVFICKKEKLLPRNAANIDLKYHNSSTSSSITDSCVHVNINTNPFVSNFDGPIFLEVVFHPGSKRPQNPRHSMDIMNDRLFFNFTYEMKYFNKATTAPDHFDYSIIKDKYPCNLNGIPILKQIKSSFYKFICSCNFQTEGENCQWGPHCTKNADRRPCYNRGKCIMLDREVNCICDKGHSRPNCLPSNIKWTREYVTRTIRMKYTTFSYNASRQQLENEYRRLHSCSEDLEEIEYDVNIDIAKEEIKVLNLPDRLVKKMEQPKFLKSFLNKSCCFFNKKRFPGVTNSVIKSLTLIPTMYEEIIQIFNYDIKETNYLEICLHIRKGNFSVNFYKDGHIINEVAVNSGQLSSSSHQIWKINDYEIDFHFGDQKFNQFCLWVGHVTDDDFGNYEAMVDGEGIREKAVNLSVNRGEHIDIVIEPRTPTVKQGSNMTLICKLTTSIANEAIIEFDSYATPSTSYTHYSASRVGKRYYVTIFQLKDHIHVTCDVTVKQKGKSKSGIYNRVETSIHVLTDDSPHCLEGNSDKLHWNITPIERMRENPCPEHYQGICTRLCLQESGSKTPSWRRPDCSNCRKDINIKFFKKLNLYKRGIHSYIENPENVIKEFISIISKQEFLSGEVGNILNNFKSVLTEDDLKPSYESFWTLLDILLQAEYPFMEHDLFILEDIIRQKPWKPNDPRSLQSMVEKKKITSMFFRRPTNISQPVADLRIPFPSSISQNQCWSSNNSNRYVNVKVEGSVEVSSMNFVLFWNVPHILPFHEKISSYFADCTIFSTYSQAISPFIQVDAYHNNSRYRSDDVITTLTIPFCGSNKQSNRFEFYCARYIPHKKQWSTYPNCSLKISDDFSYTCECRGTEGWMGFMCADNQLLPPGNSKENRNFVVATASGISLSLLSVAGLLLVVMCCKEEYDFVSKFSRFVDIAANLIINAVFLHDSINSIDESEFVTFLMLISCCFVLSQSMAVSHLIAIFLKHSYGGRTHNLSAKIEYYSFLVIVVASVTAAMLEIIVWMISKISSVTPSCIWLSIDNAVSVTIISYMSVLFLLLLALSSFNFRKIKNIKQVDDPYSINTSEISSELRSHTLLFLLEFIHIIITIYRSRNAGRYLFAMSDITLSIVILYVYVIPFPCYSDSNQDFENRRPEDSSRNENGCLWKRFFKPSLSSNSCNERNQNAGLLHANPAPTVIVARKEQPYSSSQSSRETDSGGVPLVVNPKLNLFPSNNSTPQKTIDGLQHYLTMGNTNSLEMEVLKNKVLKKRNLDNFAKVHSVECRICYSQSHKFVERNKFDEPPDNIKGCTCVEYNTKIKKQGEASLFAKSVHSSPFLHRGGRGLVGKVSSKFSLFAKRNLCSSRNIQSYEQLGDGGIRIECLTQDPRIVSEYPRNRGSPFNRHNIRRYSY